MSQKPYIKIREAEYDGQMVYGILAEDHPVRLHLREGEPIHTSRVVNIDPISNLVETRNSIYEVVSWRRGKPSLPSRPWIVIVTSKNDPTNNDVVGPFGNVKAAEEWACNKSMILEALKFDITQLSEPY